LLVPPRDPAPLAAALTTLLDAPDRWRLMGKRGRETVEAQFSARAMVRQMESLYITTLRRRGMPLEIERPVAVSS
jgi:glycosyltransferase involved in cell wall biosynthesis